MNIKLEVLKPTRNHSHWGPLTEIMNQSRGMPAVVQKTRCTLIIDGSREHQITVHEKAFEGISVRAETITTGDYVVVSPTNEYLAVIERKSLDDYAASIKDGRIRNTQKLVELRRKTGCKIIYLIEGENMRPDAYIGRSKMTYRMIESNMFHQVVRDGICIIRTSGTLDTAETLARFVQSMDTLVVKSDIADLQDVPPDTFTPVDDMMSLLKEQHHKTDHQVVCEMWSCFAGITADSADEYNKMWSIGDIVCGKIPRTVIDGMKLSNGRKISKRAKASLMGITKVIEARLLSKVPGISAATANQLTTERPLNQLLSYDVGALSMRKVGKSQKSLGETRAKKILDLFWYKYVPGEAAPPRPPAAQPPPPQPPMQLLNFPILDVPAPPPTVKITEDELNDLLSGL